MIAITKLKLDNRGRITFPKTFLDANDIKYNSYVKILPVYNDAGAVKVRFTFKAIPVEEIEDD